MKRVFDVSDQHAFAGLSGDWNPVHVDPEAARRTPFGACVVHGVHTLLWALDAVLDPSGTVSSMEQLKVTFRQPLYLGEAAFVEPGEASDPSDVAFEVTAGGRRVLSVACRLGGARGTNVADEGPLRGASEPLTFDEAAQVRGRTPLAFERARAAEMFPRLVRRLEPESIALLLGSTRVVGMRCPGLHSIFSGMQVVARTGLTSGPDDLLYEVTKADRRFSRLVVTLSSPKLRAEVQASFRPIPVAQPSLDALRSRVKPGEFSGWRALVVGGSRGLGEVAAKLVVAGGGEVVLTYCTGALDATRVADETGGRALRWDVTAAPSLDGGWRPTHLLYFATPSIKLDPQRGFSEQRFHDLVRYYVTGFLATVRAVRRGSVEPLGILYPSTVYLDEPAPGSAEYCAAKAAGEALCRQLADLVEGVTVTAPRLPRLRTDQTHGILSSPAEDPIPYVLGALRTLGSGAREPS